MLQVKVINPDRIVFEGEAEYVMAPGRIATLGILPGHTPYYGELVSGDIYIEKQRPESITIKQGLIRVVQDTVTILMMEE